MPDLGAPGAVPEFGDPDYWQEYYSTQASPSAKDGDDESVFDWLQGWDGLASLLEPILAYDKERAVLHLGCGNSTLAEDFYDHGYLRQTSLDLAPAAVHRMQARNIALRPGMCWLVADATNVGELLPSQSFDLVIEKATLDTLVCADQHALAVGRLLWEASRLVKSGGVFVSVSMYSPRMMLRWLKQPAFGWQVRIVELYDDIPVAATYPQVETPPGRPPRKRNKHYVYTCTRRLGAPGGMQLWEQLLERLQAHPDSDVSEPEDGDTDALPGRPVAATQRHEDKSA